MLQSLGSQRFRHDLKTEQQQNEGAEVPPVSDIRSFIDSVLLKCLPLSPALFLQEHQQFHLFFLPPEENTLKTLIISNFHKFI